MNKLKMSCINEIDELLNLEIHQIKDAIEKIKHDELALIKQTCESRKQQQLTDEKEVLKRSEMRLSSVTIYHNKQELMQFQMDKQIEILNIVEEQLIDYAKSNQYLSKLTNKVKELLDGEKSMKIHLSRQDYFSLNQMFKSQVLILDEQIKIGGYAIHYEKIRVDETFDTIFHDQKEWFCLHSQMNLE